MAREYHRLLFVFIDGIGLAAATDDNPFAAGDAPAISALLGGPMTIESCGLRDDCALIPLDARLGVPGLPQSATGQAALFTGINAARRMGRHVTGFPGPRLRELVARHGLLGKASAIGSRTTFANAYSLEYLSQLETGAARSSVTTCLVQAAGLPFRTEVDLRAGRAATWDVVGDLFGDRSGSHSGVPLVEPRAVGAQLAAVAARGDLTLYETFLPDLVGHRRVAVEDSEVVRRIDGLLAGILAQRHPLSTLIVTSDHGNFESSSKRTHTLNPVPLLVVGPGVSRLDGRTSITSVTPLVMDILADAPGDASS